MKFYRTHVLIASDAKSLVLGAKSIQDLLISALKKYKLEDEAALQFTGMHTPDNGYYVGVDNKSMMHPQTLLCYELNGKPLPMKQGYPLRLIIPVKYGVKHLKRIGTIYFSNNRPPDYWYERGYDYYCGF